MGRLVDCDQHPGLDNRPDRAARFPHVWSLTRRIDRIDPCDLLQGLFRKKDMEKIVSLIFNARMSNDQQ